MVSVVPLLVYLSTGRSSVAIKHDALGLTSSHQMSAQVGAKSSSEQVGTSRLRHQMSLARAGAKGSLCSEVQCIMDNGYMTAPSPQAQPPPPWTRDLTLQVLPLQNGSLPC